MDKSTFTPIARRRPFALRGPLVATLVSILIAEPVMGQQWMERFLKEQEAQKTTREISRKQRQQRRPAPTPTPAPPATSLEEVIEEEGEVRRAVPIEPFNPPAPVEPEPAADEPEATPPAAEPVEAIDPNLPIRKAEPVVAPPAPEAEVAPPPPAAEAAPTTAEVAPEVEEDDEEEEDEAAPRRRRTAREALDAPVEILPNAPAGRPAEGIHDRGEDEPPGPPPQESVAATPSAEPSKAAVNERLDPGTQEIRVSPGAATAPPDKVQFSYANHLYARKNYDRAIIEFERYLAMHGTASDRQAAYFRLAESYRQTGSTNAARKNYEALIFSFQVGEFIGPASYRLAEIFYNEQNYTNAVTFFRKASVWVKDPSIILSSQFYAARALEAAGRQSEAIRGYEELLASPGENPFREASQLALVELYTREKRPNQALALLHTLREETQKASVKAEATARIGILYLELGENPKALRELKEALTLPEIGRWRELAEIGVLRLLYNDGKYEEAIKAFEESEKKFSRTAMPEVLLVIGNSYRQLGQREEANRYYDQIVKEYPKSPYAGESQYERLVSLYTTDAPELIEAIDTYLAANPEKGVKRDQLELMKAESLYKTKRYLTASTIYAGLVDSGLNPSLKAEVLFKLGWCYAQTGHHQEAIDAFSKFLTGYPANKLTPVALAQRGFSYEQLRQYKEALADFDAVISDGEKSREREFALQHKALILGQQEENRGMVEAFKQLLAEFPESPAAGQANYWIGRTAYQARDYRNALDPLRKARELDKDFAEKSTPLLLAALRYLEDRDGLAAEVDRADEKTKITPEIFQWLGTQYLKVDQPEPAAKYLARLTDGENTEGVDAENWLLLGQAQVRLGEWEKAKATLGLYLKKAEGTTAQARGQLTLAQAHLGAGELDEAQQAANRVQELQAEGRLNAQARMELGNIAMARSDFEGAAKLFLSISIVFDDPQLTPQAMEKAYLSYRKAGDETRAAKTLNDLQTRFPEYQVKLTSN